MFRRVSLVVALLFTVVLAPHARAADERDRVAVFPLDTSKSKLDDSSKVILEEGLRTIAGNMLTPLGYIVLTSETTIKTLKDNGIDPSKACEASCVLEAAQELNIVKVFVAGSASTSGKDTFVFIRVYDVSGAVLSSIQLRGADVSDLMNQLDKSANTLFAAVPSLKKKAKGPKGPQGKEESFKEDNSGWGDSDDEATAWYDFSSKPAGAFVLLDGKILCKSTPCRKTVAVGRHEVSMQLDRYDDVSQTILAMANKDEKLALELPPTFALLSVETNPPGISVSVSGKSSKNISNMELNPGSYTVEIDDPCYLKAGQTIVLKKTDVRSIKLETEERLSEIKVSASDADDNELRAEVSVDGKSLGSTPKAFRIPLCSKEVVVTAEEGKPYRESLTGGKLREKQRTAINAVIGAASAWLDVTAVNEAGEEVRGADVQVDGKSVGTTPGKFKVGIEASRISVSTDDAEFSKSLSLSPKATEEIKAELKPKYVPPPAPVSELPSGRDLVRVDVGSEGPIVAAPQQLITNMGGASPVALPSDNPSGLTVRARVELDKRAGDDSFRIATTGFAQYNAYLGDALSPLSYVTDDVKIHLGIGELDEINWTTSLRHHRVDTLENPALPWGALPGAWEIRLGGNLPFDDNGKFTVGALVGYDTQSIVPRYKESSSSDSSSSSDPVWNYGCQQIGLCNQAALLPYQWGGARYGANARLALSSQMLVRADVLFGSYTFDQINAIALPGVYTESSLRRITGRLEWDPMRYLSVDVEAGQVQYEPKSNTTTASIGTKAEIIGKVYAKVRPVSFLSLGVGYDRNYQLVGGFENLVKNGSYLADAALRLGSTITFRAKANYGDYEYANGRKDTILSVLAEARVVIMDELVIVGTVTKNRRSASGLKLPIQGDTSGGVTPSPVTYPTNGYNFDQLAYYAGAEYLF